MDSDEELNTHAPFNSELDDEEQEFSDVVTAALALYQKQLNDVVVTVVASVSHVISLATQRKEPIPYHTSILTGRGWVMELLEGHPERIRCELGVHKTVFRILVAELQNAGYHATRNVSSEEQLAIFLYACVTGLSVRHIGERFQRSNETISRYFKQVLKAFSSPTIYRKYVRLPRVGDPTPDAITEDPHFWPYFEHAIGTIDGTHIPCTPSAEDREAARNRKGFTSQNCLVCCDFDMKFTYVLSGWEGSAADATVYHDARVHELTIPPGKYYLADAGFPSCHELLIPFRGERYHLAEWGRAQVQPVNRREYFNLRHSQLCNVVERIIGVLKRRFCILIVPPEYDMNIQAQIPIACCCVHNVIRTYDGDELTDMEIRVADPADGLDLDMYGVTAHAPPTAANRDFMARQQEGIATAMWKDYAAERARRGDPVANIQGD